MQTDNHFFNDLSRMFSGFMGTAQGLQKEAAEQFRQMIEKCALDAGFVHHSDFEALEKRVVLLCDKVKDLEAKLEESTSSNEGNS
ncbi:MAG: accessory factor UbiK family protein [Pseudomonadota bacterium]